MKPMNASWIQTDLLRDELNAALAGEPITVGAITQLRPRFPEAVEITYTDTEADEQSVLIGTLLTPSEQADKEERQKWVGEVAEAMIVSKRVREEGGDA